MQQTLQIDIETYSPVDIKKAGVYPYANHPEFEILLFAFAFNDEPVEVIDLASGEKLPCRVMEALQYPGVLKTAFNALFERTCINVWLVRMGELPTCVEQWECTMVKAAMLGLPLSLGKVAEVLQISQQKMLIGMQLIRYFCIPCKPSATNGGRTRNLPPHDPAKWTTFKLYNKVDVETERGIRKAISYFEIPKLEKLLYILDQQINDRGVLIDRQFVENAINVDLITRDRLMESAMALTGLDNPNSGAQMKAWLLAETGEDIKSLTKASIPDILKKCPSELVAKVMGLKLELNKTSVKKYQAMINAVGSDDRIRGLTQFYGANRTGRWCLAEGTKVKVLGPDGIISETPIQLVLKDDLVFDGNNWVVHEGVVFSGNKRVITWDGVTATKEHYVYVSSNVKVSLQTAKSKKLPLWKGNI